MTLHNTICLGVAGNFAHHLAQAGELKEFESVKTTSPDAPKGIFPFYIPHATNFLGVYPISTDRLTLPDYPANTHLEPEIGILFDILYNNNHQVIDLIPKKFTTFNDCTIRKEHAQKISEKKSWGTHSKGIGDKWIEIDQFEHGGIMDYYHLCSFVKRDGILHPYGVDAPLLGYSYFYRELRLWLIEKINTQEAFGPLEEIKCHLHLAQYPTQAFISIGATAYSNFGENNYLQDGDEIYVIAYDARIEESSLHPSNSKVILYQKVSKP